MILAITVVAGFVTAIRLNAWPMGSGPFNVWINLPTFDPTYGGDVVDRVEAGRQAQRGRVVLLDRRGVRALQAQLHRLEGDAVPRGWLQTVPGDE